MKGQISVEFMILVSILLLIFAGFLVSGTSLQQRLFGIKSNTEAQKLTDSIAFEINAAVRAGDGYKRKFYVEKNFFGASDFNVSVEGYSVVIDWDDRSVTSRIITNNINGSIGKGWNLIENINGSVYVS